MCEEGTTDELEAWLGAVRDNEPDYVQLAVLGLPSIISNMSNTGVYRVTTTRVNNLLGSGTWCMGEGGDAVSIQRVSQAEGGNIMGCRH